jgi:hypothetical protein
MVVCAGKIETLKRSIEEVGSRRRFVTPAAASATPRPSRVSSFDFSHMMFHPIEGDHSIRPAPLRSPHRLAVAVQ